MNLKNDILLINKWIWNFVNNVNEPSCNCLQKCNAMINGLLGPDHVQMTKVFWRLKVNWKNLQKYFCKFFQFTLLILNHVLWVNSIASIKSQLQNFFPHFALLTIHLFWVTIDFWWLQLTLLKAHDSLQVKWIVKNFCRKYFQFTFSLQFTFSCKTLAHDPALYCTLLINKKVRFGLIWLK